MALEKYEYNLNDLSNEKGFRFDIKFLKYNIVRNKGNQYYVFNELFDIIEKQSIEVLDEFKYAEISDTYSDGTVEPIFLKMDNAETDLINADYYKKIIKGDIIKPHESSILISSVRPNLKKFIFIDNGKNDVYFTKAFIELFSKKLNPIVMYYSLRTVLFQNIISVARQGKGYPTLSSKDLKYVLFDKRTIDSLYLNQNILLKKIIPIIEEINIFQKKIMQDATIINTVFSSKFKLNLQKLHELQKERYNTLTLNDFANNKDLRNSCKFHCQSSQYAYNELKLRFSTKIKKFISEPIVLGASISPSDYDENGEYYYLSMATVKNWYFNPEDAQTVSEEYKNSNIAKDIKKNDIIITRSGVAIGKVAIIQDDVNAIFADFTMRIRLKNYNPLFAYYYFRSAFFQELIHTHKKGLQNKNIFPIQIQEFPIPNIDLDEQQKIVDIIQRQINEQNIIRNKIKELRNKIDNIISDTINKLN